jgi:hypothetical protein
MLSPLLKFSLDARLSVVPKTVEIAFTGGLPEAEACLFNV